MIRKVLILLLCMAFASELSAQAEKILLKNGSVVKADIEVFGKESLQVRLDAYSVMSIPIRSIKEIGIKRWKTQLNASQLMSVDSLNGYAFEPGFRHQVRFGMMMGQESFFLRELSGVSIDYTFSRQFTRSLSVGLGIGLDHYTSFQTIPFYVEVRKELGRLLAHPFVYASAGYSLARGRKAFSQEPGPVRGNSIWTVGAGYSWPIGKNSMHFTFGFKRQQLESKWETGDFRWATDWNLRRMELKIGFVF